jgi:hypothetical protein
VPQCTTDGGTCSVDANCCSLNCRNVTATSRVCITPLTDFQDYQSVFAVCSNHPEVKTADDVNSALKIDAGAYDTRTYQIYFSEQDADAYQNAQSTQSEARISDGWTEVGRKASLATSALSGLVWPKPQQAISNTFTTITNLVSDAMQFTILVMLFIVIEIIITMTLMKDFAMLIGGEPRVFGMSRLV